MQPQVPPSQKFPKLKDPSPCKLSIAVQFWDPGSTFLLIFKNVIKILVFLILGDSKTKKFLFPALPLDFRPCSGMGKRRAQNEVSHSADTDLSNNFHDKQTTFKMIT